MIVLPFGVSSAELELIPSFRLDSTRRGGPDPGVDLSAADWSGPILTMYPDWVLRFMVNTGGWSWKSVKNALDDYMSVIIK